MHYFRFMRTGSYELVPKTKIPRRQNPKGYVFIYAPDHPLAHKNGYVYEHRKIVFDKYGFDLPPCELCGAPLNWKTCHVDHIDMVVTNNIPENLRPLCRPCNTFRHYPEQHTIRGRHSITFEGRTMTPHEWSRDPRVKVASHTIIRRKMAGMTDEEALFSPKITHNGRVPVKSPRPPAHTRKNSISITIGGVTQTSAEWSRHADCRVSDSTIRNRIKAGMDGYAAVFNPPATGTSAKKREELRLRKQRGAA